MEPLPYLGSLSAQLRAPARLAVAPDDSILVTDPLNRHVAKFDASGSLMGAWPIPAGPIGVAVHPDGRIFVSLRDEHKVAAYDSSFNFLEYVGEDEPLVAFVGPTDIEIAGDTRRIYVIDAEGDRVYAFEEDGSLAMILGLRGKWPGQFIYPSAIAIDEQHRRIIIADHDKWRLQTFTTSGVFLQQFGDRKKQTPTGSEGWMPRPLGLTVDAEGNIYVTDALMGTVRVFEPSGAELGKVVDYGYKEGELRVPLDLALSNDGSRLYVVSSSNSSVEIYDTSGGLQRDARNSSVPVIDEAQEMPDVSSKAYYEPGATQETAWNGPHIVEDRPNICWPCHGITGQPGTHAGTIEGQSVLCMSCHNAAGRALTMIIHEGDVADPFGTNPAAADGMGRSHAWGVPAVDPLTSSVGPLPGSPMLPYLDDDGNINCSTCHNQHNIDSGPYLRINNTGDAMCKECHAPLDRSQGDGGSHPVGFAYPEGEDEYPLSENLGSLFVKDSMVECMTCHAPHGADSGGANDGAGDGMLLRGANDETLCQTCHTQHTIHFAEGEWEPTCRDCHDMHDTNSRNLALIAREISGTAVTFVEGDAACNEFGRSIHAVCDPPTYDGVCEVCHTNTDYHLNNAGGDHAHYTDMRCIDCHPHSNGFLASEDYCLVCHGDPPDGTVSPNRSGAHAVHLTGTNGPNMPDCYDCHPSEDADTHDNGVITFVSGTDTNDDGDIDLSETDVCDACHGLGGSLDGVNDPVIGAKINWYDSVYVGDTLHPEKVEWCAGCHDEDPEGARVNDVKAPEVAGDNENWGYNLHGHGVHHVVCTECHDPTLSHTDGVEVTFSLRFPLRPSTGPKPPEEREIDREAYNNGYRLRRIDGERALDVPREGVAYDAANSRLCFECHDEVPLMGVPIGYELYPPPPPYLLLPPGVAQTNYRNELPWGWGWDGKPANAHWRHMALTHVFWDADQDGTWPDSAFTCVTCHNPHGTRDAGGEPTIAMTMGDLDITYGVYNDGVTEWPYAYIGSDGYFMRGGDLFCKACHADSGAGEDPPRFSYHTRFYREPLDLWPEECGECHE
ncbi:MAG: 6-bladed beta-propeller [Phycisphaerales bacterium]|nr:MAG: 6-bladed beta-propeller [Phycisphaerales bacterium]